MSYSFGNSNGAVFTIYRGGYGAEILANKLTMSVFYEKVFRRRNEVENFAEIQTIMGSKREDSSTNKMGASSNIVQLEKENVVENGGTNAIIAMVEKKDENSNRRADDQKVLGTTENQLVAAEGIWGDCQYLKEIDFGQFESKTLNPDYLELEPCNSGDASVDGGDNYWPNLSCFGIKKQLNISWMNMVQTRSVARSSMLILCSGPIVESEKMQEEGPKNNSISIPRPETRKTPQTTPKALARRE
ncbi:hypothetical protein LguiB_021039 [Lonicera macranthoides]